ncbi:MAG: hypothetical protein R2827_09160 [Bdellovibrionales bacterium]
MQEGNDDVIWQELSYAVPAKMIGEYLSQLLLDQTLTGWKADVVQDMLSDSEMVSMCPVCN